MIKRVIARNGHFVLTEYGFEQFKVRKSLEKDNTTVPISWVEKGYVKFVKEGK